ncbi:hypothetical protein CXZ10_05845 [Pleomorphomonas diazotrophica]|uniref:DUF3168 domain-containing protein n=1 Tax=Pleomorphomonas diazotrophica TaxID=1166257 RepID=A0A1I4Q809_9HYPH|nr:hypothetical protein [Pleomorphomonas diazotrophica]PKR90871.1 hypothetical protein CXZ10_05845 [Pleomorphomonas diazotrophica]SFM36209.1 hypothetical protein SAMN05192571_101142 [Pleomorphomonas diazotrophica]
MIAEIRQRLLVAGTPFALVEGAVALAQLTDRPPQLPASYVFMVREASEPNDRMNGPVMQRTACDIAVVIIFEQLAEPLGEPAADELETMLAWERAQLIGFGGTTFEPLEHVSGELVQAKGGAVWWQDTYGTAYYQEEQT